MRAFQSRAALSTASHQATLLAATTRAVARGDARLAQRFRDEWPLAGRFLSIVRGRPILNDAVAFNEVSSRAKTSNCARQAEAEHADPKSSKSFSAALQSKLALWSGAQPRVRLDELVLNDCRNVTDCNGISNGRSLECAGTFKWVFVSAMESDHAGF